MTTTVTRNRQEARQQRAARVQASIAAAVACPLCPEVTTQVGLEVLTKTLGATGGRRWWKATNTTRQQAAALAADPRWRERALRWIDTYGGQHGHGPTWRRLWDEQPLWPTSMRVALLNEVMRQLCEGGWLDGTKTPFGLCRRVSPNRPALGADMHDEAPEPSSRGFALLVGQGIGLGSGPETAKARQTHAPSTT
ncbi:hypothetical protein [Streptomyces sp. WAC 06725]|uniref:hypothetical protein n=1 Tax=Streptomyces sp. WAC 06725 TaxID=2203209 RepID=UPI000F736B4C|nr:hypothetical protein [Streptomyces sp. WAC 06725]